MAASSLLSSISIPHSISINTSQNLGLVNPSCHATIFSGNLKTSQITSANKRSRTLIVRATPEVAGDFLSGVLPFWPPSDNNSWLAWGTGLCVAIPLITARLLTLSKQVDAAAEAVEKVADVVGNVAHDVDKAAENFKENLPAGKLKDLVETIEHVAEETAKDAQIVEDLMDKVEELDDKLEEFLHHGSNKSAKTSPIEEQKL